jgi:peptidoglycan/xylan/chitin deacetylase (PgdA/CDA1 family)
MDRRRFLRLLGRSALAASGVHFLKLHTAFAGQAVDCPIYLFHMPSAAQVDRVIRSNAAAGRLPVTVGEIARILQGDQEAPGDRLFALTFDDGYLSQYQLAVPVLERFGVPATFFVMGTGWQGDGVHQYMSPAQIQELAGRGHEIGSHTVNHPNLVSLRQRNLGAYLGEIVSSKTQLEELVDDEVTSFCYPNGSFNAAVAGDVARLYRAAATEIRGSTQSDALLLRRLQP